ncbi:MAG: hypothetical protein GX849_08710 [Clostridiaceae bacterium]|nr:hypothetical protein [Clostridiaceae bacterium]
MIHKQGRHIVFGKGDIGIHIGCNSDAAMLMFRNLERPFPIGKLVKGRETQEVELLDTDVVMSFSNAESIDALMNCLKIIRRSLRVSAAQASRTADCHE